MLLTFVVVVELLYSIQMFYGVLATLCSFKHGAGPHIISEKTTIFTLEEGMDLTNISIIVDLPFL